MATDTDDTLAARLSKLGELVRRNSEVVFDPLHPYPICVKFALGRAFGFADLASRQDPATAFFIVPALRAVTEDLILFRFLHKTGTPEERDMVIKNLMLIDVHTKIDYQTRFFSKFRPFQPVLASPVDSDRQVMESKFHLAEYWRGHGWPRFNCRGTMPPIRELAEKADPGLLEVVYDFIYRLASGEVHSTPRALLRLGWGTSRKPGDAPLEAEFSTGHLGPYHLEMAQVYGTYLLCLWFELFDDQFDTSGDDLVAVSALRDYLLSRGRWPEMVTFEEMNVKVPDSQGRRWPNFLIAALYTVISKDGFVAGMETILHANQSDQQDTEH